jgi:hypothetical protein
MSMSHTARSVVRAAVLTATFLWAALALCLPEPRFGIRSSSQDLITGPDRVTAQETGAPKVLLLGVGDSLMQGTMDAINNRTNIKKAFLFRVSQKLRKSGMPLKFVLPLLNNQEKRANPQVVPTNLGVDGEDLFSLVGLEYGKRVGSPVNFLSEDYTCDKLLPNLFTDMHDKVLYPINLRAGQPVTQLDALIWHLNHRAGPAVVCFWVGNNDSGLAALGLGGKNPEFLPFPYAQIKSRLSPSLQFLLDYGEKRGDISFSPFTPANIKRNLTARKDFVKQYNDVLLRINSEADLAMTDIFLCTFPYYCDVGYLFGREDLAYYLDTDSYQVPQFSGRVSLLTFICMYALQKSGESQTLDRILLQEDGLVLSLTGAGEYKAIKARIRAFNRNAGSLPGVHIVDTGERLNTLFTEGLEVGGTVLTRGWSRGGAFSLDGVHPGYTAHAHIANLVLERMNEVLGVDAPFHNLKTIMKKDVYVDRDGDGWVNGPSYKGFGRTRILHMFKDADGDSGSDHLGEARIDRMEPDEVWDLISEALLEEIIDIPAIRAEAIRIGCWPPRKK